jgi:hypothetical protein
MRLGGRGHPVATGTLARWSGGHCRHRDQCEPWRSPLAASLAGLVSSGTGRPLDYNALAPGRLESGQRLRIQEACGQREYRQR